MSKDHSLPLSVYCTLWLTIFRKAADHTQWNHWKHCKHAFVFYY